MKEARLNGLALLYVHRDLNINFEHVIDECSRKNVVVVVITPPLPRDGGMTRMAIQVHAVNLIEIRLGERWQLISNQSLVTSSPTTNKADCPWWVPKNRLVLHAGLTTSQL